MKYQSSLKAKLIYIFRINDKAHAGCVKIGEATLPEASSLNLPANCHELNQAAKTRINQYTQTAGVDYDLLHAKLKVVPSFLLTTRPFTKFCFAPVSNVMTSVPRNKAPNGLNVICKPPLKPSKL